MASGRTTETANGRALVSVPDVAVTVNSNRPSFVGWPLSTPVLDASTTPGGSAPLVTAKVTDAEPPVATSLSAYGRPTMAAVSSSMRRSSVNGTPNVAPTVPIAVASFTVQAAVPAHDPLQPRNCAPGFGTAVSETVDCVPWRCDRNAPCTRRSAHH